MHFIPTSIRGPVFMILATGSYVVSDTAMKLATEGLPAYEVLMLRGAAAALWGMPLLFLLGYGRKLAMLADGRVLTRNFLELIAILAYIVALANMQIADSTALGQITPLLILVGASGFSYEEAADICECAVGTIKSRVNRARTRLAKLLAVDNIDEFGPDHTTRAVLMRHES